MRHGSLLATLTLLLFALPHFASADVLINEVAWMGTDAGGANCEWVELRNTDDNVVDLTTWTLTIENAGSATPKVISLNEAASVKYSGIAANGYYLIARDSGSCKDLSPATSADWLGSFGNGIGNSGAKLILKNGTEEEDVVDAKAGWEVTKGGAGGKNTAPKETPQRAGALWITAAPTPRSPNHSAPLIELPEEEEDDTPPVVTVGGTAPLVPVADPVPELFVDGGPSRIIMASADSRFSAVAYDSVGEVRRHADIAWSFGDGGHEKGSEVMYAYRKPGDYTAVVRARDNGVSAVALVKVTVTESGVVISSLTEDGFTLTNESDRLADLSGWRLGSGKKSAKLPQDTVIAAHTSAFFPYDTLHLASSTELSLKFPSGKVAFAYAQPATGETGLYEVQALPPARTLALAPKAYVDADIAPAPQETLTVAGAATHTPTVVLKDDEGVFGGIASLMASAFASVTGIFSR